MPLVDVDGHDLLKQLVQRLIGVCHQQSALLRIVVVEVRNYLHCHVSFS